MKKIISVLLLLSFVLTLTSLSYAANAQIAIGSRSEEVKFIQEILKTDPNIYPEGYVTGYYGPLTTEAIKKLQKKCGLPETGVLDENTEKCIFPVRYQIKVISPNGGEIWDRNQIQTIKWEVIAPTGEEIKPYPFWPKASIDLFRKVEVTCPICPTEAVCIPCVSERSVFVKHIATVNLFDQAYSWKITPNILNGKDYLIRISLGKKIVPVWYREKLGQSLPSPEEIWPQPTPPTAVPPLYINWDESDGTFEITGEIVKPPAPNLEEVIKILEKIIEELRKAIALLKSV